jgi:hypothetical protein
MKVKLRIWSAIASFQKLGDQTDRVVVAIRLLKQLKELEIVVDKCESLES